MNEIIHLQILPAALSAWIGRRQASVITYVIDENRVLREQLESSGRRLRLTEDRRRRLVANGEPLGRRTLNQIATIMTPSAIPMVVKEYAISEDAEEGLLAADFTEYEDCFFVDVPSVKQLLDKETLRLEGDLAKA